MVRTRVRNYFFKKSPDGFLPGAHGGVRFSRKRAFGPPFLLEFYEETPPEGSISREIGPFGPPFLLEFYEERPPEGSSSREIGPFGPPFLLEFYEERAPEGSISREIGPLGRTPFLIEF